MRNLTTIFFLSGLSIFAPLAGASTFIGSWHNTTFDTSGALTVVFNVSGSRVSGSIDANGNVFGGGNPPAIPFRAVLNEDGSGDIDIPDTPMGDISGSVDEGGHLSVVIRNIPGGLTEARFDGFFDLGGGRFQMTYEIDDSQGLYAEGYAEGYVPKSPTLKVAKRIKYSGKTGKTEATVVSTTKITSFKAKAKGAKVKVKGKNPYKIILKKAKKKVTRVKLTVTTEGGLKTRKYVKFIRK